MGLFGKHKKKHLTLQINARLQPIHRGDIYEDPIGEALEARGCGFVDGGGTMMRKSGEIEFCDVEITLNDGSDDTTGILLSILEEIGIPKGSFLMAKNFEFPVGRLEGLALYLNGTELPDEVYETCDINYVMEKIDETLNQFGKMYSYWEGPQDTALYFYGASFEVMNEKMAAFLAEYPLCQKCRIEQIA